MATAYYGVKLSPNVVKTDEGYLVFRNAVIARTGFQRYKGSEIPESEIENAGIKINPDDDVDVYRSPEEVFRPQTMASFEGKAVTDNHPPDLIDIDSHDEYQCGHMQNVRKGSEPLENGDWPLIADIHVTNKNLIIKYEMGTKELSCGYTYHLAKDGDKILQVDICGNHVAVVPNGRAGPLVAIQDAAPEKKEKLTMAQFGKKLKVLGLRALFQDSKLTDDEMITAFDAAYAKDEEEKREEKEEKAEEKAEPNAKDAKAKDRSTRMHAALDRYIKDSEAKEAEESAASDADMEELRGILSGGAGAEKSKTTEGLDEDCEEGMDSDEEENEEESEAEDSLGDHEESTILTPEERFERQVPSATDAAYTAGMKAGAKAFANALKPHVAVSRDARFKKAFDTATKVVSASSIKKNAGSYSSFNRGASKATDSVGNGMDREAKLASISNKAYAERHGKNGTK